MASTTQHRSRTTELRRPKLDRPTAMRLAATEYDRFADAIAGLSAAQWQRPTECAPWDVRALVGHVLGMAEMAASVREGSRQRKAAMRTDAVFIDALTDLQVRKHADDAPSELVAQLRSVGGRAARGRRRTPGFIRRRSMPVPQQLNGADEWWCIGYLTDTILTRDPWMHRIDLGRATGNGMQVTAEHDGVIVADVVAEWLERHGQPVALHLTGPAGGTWGVGTDGPQLELDAIEFCRVLSGRQAGTGLLATEVPF
jgi:uncharacterized protein (TIGR03083 family)